ncbi:hypothetical protein ELS24_10340 [Achromobacter spanius]|uniref:hypothetical protein n=1 Tax=Achromobacter spanius TaxID=217203 RepID=UPI000F8FBCE0|nr:hypothetical protein [Achromobacter spanius]AZS78807.1 hypothetical protein ELS24_10340 [Achromobacter spanius]
MRSDRELLELAATAAGLEFHWIRLDSGWLMQASEPGSRSEESWNPLVNDGDALLLAADLRLQFEEAGDHRCIPRTPEWDGVWIVKQIRHRRDTRNIVVTEEHGKDRIGALRRAIVRAAAEIAAQHPRTDGGGRE